MARPKRINLPYTLYHVFSRTNSDGAAFGDTADREMFLHYLSKFTALFQLRVHAWCLMDTHFHLLLETGERPALSEFMKRLLTAYTVYFNRRHRLHGHLFQGRYKSLVVEKSSYLLAVSRYIHLNPALTAKPANAEKFEGSSLRYFINGGEPPFLETAETLAWFKGNRKKYAEFVREGLKKDVKPEVLQQSFIGGKPFADRIAKRLMQMEKEGSRAEKSRRRQEGRASAAEAQKAKAILSAAAGYFGLTARKIKKARHGRRTLGTARTVAAVMLRENLPWTAEQIAACLGLRSKSVFSYHLKKSDDSTIRGIIQKICITD